MAPDRHALKARTDHLSALAKEQMGRLERGFLPLSSLASELAEDERVDALFGCQVEGKQAVAAITDRRLIVARGAVFAKSQQVRYDQIHQIDTSFMKVKIKGSGIDVEMKNVSRQQELVEALERARGARSTTAPAVDPTEQLQRLLALRDSGALTPDEFDEAKKRLLDSL